MDCTSSTDESLGILETVNDTEVATTHSDHGKIILDRLTPPILECTRQLGCLWQEMGINGEQLHRRLEMVVLHVQDLFSDMVNDEKEIKALLVSSVEDFQQKLRTLSQELQYEPYKTADLLDYNLKDNVTILHSTSPRLFQQCQEDTPIEGLTLIALEKDLRTKAGEWEMEKYDKVNAYEEIRETESKLCKRLDLPVHDIGTEEIPSKKHLNEMEQNIKYMGNKLVEHVEQFMGLRLTIFNLWEDLESIPESEFETNLAKEDSEVSFVMSRANIDALIHLKEKFEKEKKKNFAQASRLWGKWKSLRDRLRIEDSQIEIPNVDRVGFKPSAIEELKKEVEKLEVLKLEHVKEFIENTREELVEIWDKCFFGETKRQEFTPAFDESYTVEALELHEHQLNIMRAYYKENSDIYKLVEQREAMWKKLLQLELQESDPKRLFSNRGGALLKELKTRNKLSANIPKVEENLKRMIGFWEEENGENFMVYEDRYIEVILVEREIYQQQKEMQKSQRQKTKKATMTKEMTFGSKPKNAPVKPKNAPVKRNGSTIQQGTPTTSKSKRMNQSGSLCTSGTTKFGQSTSHLCPITPSRLPLPDTPQRHPDTSGLHPPQPDMISFRSCKMPKVLANRLSRSKTYKRRSITLMSNNRKVASKSPSDNESTTNENMTIVSEEGDKSGESLMSYDQFSSRFQKQKDETDPSKVVLNSTDSTDLFTHVSSEVSTLSVFEMPDKSYELSLVK